MNKWFSVGAGMSRCKQELADFARFTSQLLHSETRPISQGCQSGQMDLTVNQAGFALRRFESYPLQSVSMYCSRMEDNRSEVSRLSIEQSRKNDGN